MSEKLKTEYTAEDFRRVPIGECDGEVRKEIYGDLARIANALLPAIVEARLQERQCGHFKKCDGCQEFCCPLCLNEECAECNAMLCYGCIYEHECPRNLST